MWNVRHSHSNNDVTYSRARVDISVVNLSIRISNITTPKHFGQDTDGPYRCAKTWIHWLINELRRMRWWLLACAKINCLRPRCAQFSLGGRGRGFERVIYSDRIGLTLVCSKCARRLILNNSKFNRIQNDEQSQTLTGVNEMRSGNQSQQMIFYLL